jgi:hypothetical protein
VLCHFFNDEMVNDLMIVWEVETHSNNPESNIFNIIRICWKQRIRSVKARSHGVRSHSCFSRVTRIASYAIHQQKRNWWDMVSHLECKHNLFDKHFFKLDFDCRPGATIDSSSIISKPLKWICELSSVNLPSVLPHRQNFPLHPPKYSRRFGARAVS